MHDLHIKEYGTLENAVVGGGPQPKPAVVSFKVQWSGDTPVVAFNNPAQQYRGEFRIDSAQMEWSARSGKFEFQSDPLATSTSAAAQVGRESNGSFF